MRAATDLNQNFNNQTTGNFIDALGAYGLTDQQMRDLASVRGF